MSDGLMVAGLILTGIAALLHVYIFWLESFAWTGAARGVFGTSREEAEATRELAFNQGFYNLFLAILVAVGTVLYVADQHDAAWPSSSPAPVDGRGQPGAVRLQPGQAGCRTQAGPDPPGRGRPAGLRSQLSRSAISTRSPCAGSRSSGRVRPVAVKPCRR